MSEDSDQTKLQPSSSTNEELGVERKKTESTSRRLLRWVSKDVFDWSPGYLKTVRGILHLLHIILSILVMTLVGAGCHHHPDKDPDKDSDKDSDKDLDKSTESGTHFQCHSSAAFLFVVSTATLIQSTLLLVCRLLSKRGLAIEHATANELLYYVVFFLLFIISGFAVESNMDPKEKGYNNIMAGGVFGITNAILFLVSALWFFAFFNDKARRLLTKSGSTMNDGGRTSDRDVANSKVATPTNSKVITSNKDT